MRILLVEDDAKLSQAVAAALEASGYVVQTVADGEDAWFLGDTENYAAIILDIGLPSLDGLSILKRWRASGCTTPVLILTARGSWAERVDGIDGGADDYLPKPFHMEELLARLRAVVRRAAGHATSLIRIGDVVLDERRKQILRGGLPVTLSPLEYRAVAYLLMNRGRVVAPSELEENVYGDEGSHGSNALEVLIGRIRKKLGRDLIETRRGFGYIVREAEPES